jgi:hypothetical protein
MLKAALFALLATPAAAVVGKYCQKDSDCADYCENDPTKHSIPVFECHGGAPDDLCEGDADCEDIVGSYCGESVNGAWASDQELEEGQTVAVLWSSASDGLVAFASCAAQSPGVLAATCQRLFALLIGANRGRPHQGACGRLLPVPHRAAGPDLRVGRRLQVLLRK